MLLEFIPGTNGIDIIPSKKPWNTLGKYLQKIHSISTRGFGENLEEIQDGNADQWNKYLDDNFKSLVDQEFVTLGILDAEISHQLAEMVAELKTKEFNFALNHADFSLANIIVDELENPYIIDWGNAQSHVSPHFDLSVILEETLSDTSEDFLELLNGYGITFEQYQLIKKEIIAIRLLEAIDKLRWALARSPENVQYYKDRLQKLTSVSVSRYL